MGRRARRVAARGLRELAFVPSHRRDRAEPARHSGVFHLFLMRCHVLGGSYDTVICERVYAPSTIRSGATRATEAPRYASANILCCAQCVAVCHLHSGDRRLPVPEHENTGQSAHV